MQYSSHAPLICVLTLSLPCHAVVGSRNPPPTPFGTSITDSACNKVCCCNNRDMLNFRFCFQLVTRVVCRFSPIGQISICHIRGQGIHDRFATRNATQQCIACALMKSSVSKKVMKSGRLPVCQDRNIFACSCVVKHSRRTTKNAAAVIWLVRSKCDGEMLPV